MYHIAQNYLLLMFPPEQRHTLNGLLEAVALPTGTDLYLAERRPGHVHFLTSGMASIVTSMVDGETAEVGMVGREGMPECLHLLGSALLQTRCFMQVGGTGLRMRFKDFEQYFAQYEPVRRAVLQLVQCESVVLAQVAACNRLHEVEERLARWLLMVADRIEQPELTLTQEFLSQMLGARRSTVTLVAGSLQRAGLIRYNRGHVHILDRAGLESVACECYGITRDVLGRFRRSSEAPDGLPF